MKTRPLAALALLLPVWAACSVDAEDGRESTPAVKQREAARVRTAPVERREMVRTISTTTVVESEHEIKIMPLSSGIVTQVSVEEGDRVEAGAVLAELDRRASRAAIEQAEVALREIEDQVRKSELSLAEAENRVATTRLRWEQARREYERNEKAGLISAQALDNLRTSSATAESEHEAARLAVEGARIDLASLGTQKLKAELAVRQAQIQDADLVVRAPFAGVIAQRSLRVGDSTGPSAQAFVLTDPGALRAVVHRPQRELPMFLAARRVGAPAGDGLEIRATAEALPGREFAGAIQLVSPSIDPQSGSFRVTVKLPAGDGPARLLPGMLVRLEIVTERHPDALAVPKRALRREGGSDFVFVVADGRARRVEVKEGFSSDDAVEIAPVDGAALRAGDRVVVVGNRELEDGSEVVEERLETRAPGAADPAPAQPTAADTTATPSKG